MKFNALIRCCRGTRWLLVAACSVAAATNHALADTQHLQHITVFGARPPLGGALGGSTTVIDAQTIRAHRYLSLNEVLSSVPGVHVSTSGGGSGQTSLFMRGAESDHVLILIDGVRVTDPSAGNVAVFETLRPENIERIVVTRGPQSARYGSAAIGGVISIETKKGGDKARARARIEAATRDNQSATASFGGARDAMDYFVGVAYRRADSESVTPRRLRGGRDGEDDAWRNLNVNARLGWDLRAAGELDLSYGFVDGDSEYDGRIGNSFEASDYRQESEEHRVGARYTAPRIGALEPFVNVSSYRRVWRDKQAAAVTRYRGERTTYEFGASAFFGDKTNARVGYESQLDRAESSAAFAPLNDATRSDALYAALEFDWSSETVLSAAWRREDIDQHASKTSEQYGAQWAFPEWDANARVNYATAFKTPSATDRLFSNDDLRTESARGWDASVDKLVGACRLGAAYFHTRTRHLIEYNFATNGLENIGRASSEGVETTASCLVSERLKLNGDYGVTRALRDTDGGRERLARRPLRHAGLRALWRATSAWRWALHVDYIGPRNDVARDTFAPTRHSGYALVHVNATRRISDAAEAYLRVNNLFDKRYEPVDGYVGERFSAHLGLVVEL